MPIPPCCCKQSLDTAVNKVELLFCAAKDVGVDPVNPFDVDRHAPRERNDHE